MSLFCSTLTAVVVGLLLHKGLAQDELQDSLNVSITGFYYPIAGYAYYLQCNVTRVSDVSHYNFSWIGPTSSTLPAGMVSTNGHVSTSTLTFLPLTTSHAGRYTCTVSDGDIQAHAETTMHVLIPAPSVSITSNPAAAGIITVGSTVTLTCTVELKTGPSVNIPLTVKIEWGGPLGFVTTSTVQPVVPMGSTTTYTSTVVVREVGKIVESGRYTCVSAFNTTFSFIINNMASSAVRLTTIQGIHFSLKETILANNSVIGIAEIGETVRGTSLNNALQCITDRAPCCFTPQDRFGEWYFPNGSIVPILNDATMLYRNRGDDRAVNLNRLSNVTMPTGQYCCEVPDVNDVLQRICAIITAISIVISENEDTPFIGQHYVLTCNITGTTFATYQWRKGGSVISGETGPALTFSPLRLSDGGRYSCGNGTQFSVDKIIILKVTSPRLTLLHVTLGTINNGVDIVTAGSSVMIICTVELNKSAVTETEIPLLMVDVQLTREGTPLTLTGLKITGTTFTYTTELDSFERSDSGSYTCIASVSPGPTSTYITGSSTASDTITINAGSPPPLNVLASQASPSDPVEVSWSPPSTGATTITGYNIFYGSGDNASLPLVATAISLMLNGDYIGQTISLCTEAEHFTSQCINTTVSEPGQVTSTREIGITVGLSITLLFLVAVIITMTVAFCLWRSKLVSVNEKRNDFADTETANPAYLVVKGEECGDPNKMVSSVQDNDHFENEYYDTVDEDGTCRT